MPPRQQIPLHLGIAVCLGMMTFGLVMLIGNLAFVSPAVVRAVLDRRSIAQPAEVQSRAGERTQKQTRIKNSRPL